MHTLPAFWHAAALCSGHLDLSQAYHAHPGEVAQRTCSELEELGVSPVHAKRLHASAPLSCVVPFLSLDDASYPTQLSPVPYAPPVLFWRGNLALLNDGPMVAIVGSRRCTGDGKRMASSLARSVAESGGVVVSGMAWGIDTAAHLAAPSRTIAVLGQGLGLKQSAAAARTAQSIVSKGGLLLSEFLPTRAASKHTFPLRNRVIAGLSDLTVVVEAAQRSGASITARLALEAGREVGAVPGSPYASTSAGCLRMLAEGATLIRGPEDMLDTLGMTAATPTISVTKEDPIMSLLSSEGTRFDALIAHTGFSPATLGAALGALELQGQIRRISGDRFVLATSSSAGPCAWAPSHGSE